MLMDLLEHYAREGYAIVRRLITPAKVAALSAACDAAHDQGLTHGRSFRHGNLHYRLDHGEVRMVQWASREHEALGRFRNDVRIAQLLRPFIGGDIKQIINQVHWKKPGGRGDFAFHQDSRFRKPAHAYRNLADSYVQTGLAIDPHNRMSGGLQFVPGSHLMGDLSMALDDEVMANRPREEQIAAAGLDPDTILHLDLEPGDFVLWSPYLVHGSATNTSDHFRRFYINGYVRAADCDRGEWAFRGGLPVTLPPEQALVHYEQLYERPEPHYL
jgi:ectoine hydroxylase-related dioxygenase (phytanoyl-CoA dioxygenase family)